MSTADPVDVGICRSGPYVGSWVMGASEAVIETAIHEAADEWDGELYSWAWEFQPFEAEYDLEPALTRREALDLVRGWNVEWVDHGLAELARAMLFDNTGFVLHQKFFGLISNTVLRPMEGVPVARYPHPLKLQSVRSVLTFKTQAEAFFPQLVNCPADEWSKTAEKLLEGDFVEVSRRGWFAIDVDPRVGEPDPGKSHRVAAVALEGDPVERAKRLERTEMCLGFVPRGVSVVNDPDPVSPWEWVRELQKWSAENR